MIRILGLCALILAILSSLGCEQIEEFQEKMERDSQERAERKQEEKEAPVHRMFESAKSLPASQACKNRDAYKNLLAMERKLNTDLYQDIALEKEKIYSKRCEEKKSRELAEARRKAELEKMGDWKTGYYVDEWDDPTGNYFIRNEGSGTFSNSAVSGERVKTELRFNSSDEFSRLELRIWEYKTNLVKGIYSDNTYCSSFSTRSDKESKSIRFTQTQGSNFMQLSSSSICGEHNDLFIPALKSGETVKVFLMNGRNTNTYYNLEFETAYYKNALRKAKQEYGNSN